MKRRVVIVLAQSVAALLLSSCGGNGGSEGDAVAPLMDANAEPDDIIDAWAAADCADAKLTVNDVTKDPHDFFSADVVASAWCELPINGTRGEKTVYVEVYDSKNAVNAKLATVDCGAEYLRVVGPKWYSVMMSRTSATALQDAGADLAC